METFGAHLTSPLLISSSTMWNGDIRSMPYLSILSSSTMGTFGGGLTQVVLENVHYLIVVVVIVQCTIINVIRIT